MFPFKNWTKPQLIMAIICMLAFFYGGHQGIEEQELRNAKKQELLDQCNRYHPEYKCALMFKKY